MQILPVTREEFDEWLAMRQALYTGLDDEFHAREIEKIFSAQDMACFIGYAEGGRSAVGMIELSLRNIVDGCLDSPVGYIEGLYVKPALRGHGFGKRFVEFAANWFREAGCHDMATDAELDNVEAQAFFKHSGFDETWRIVEFKKSLR